MDESVQKVSAVSPDEITGINISGYKYSAVFIAFAITGALLGVGVSWRYKQNWISYLALISAGILGGASVGLKVSPPVRASRD